ncbi:MULTISPECIES: GIY-YIG nuclease family protein [Pseudoalteromonas]|uniref:Excinuclease ABC subunit C n=1 Tax=Pseudoalteromonas amylolytica TaxID=1859457 RepID=A0A1S1MQT8_9GAMM|nr:MULTISPECIES: GIY-YIG nuclease family protein [Pseudoalteromonas]OHU87683.1 excinuclease ABC subunit C [Pseudoalteromonas sp. JW3]OHU91125.1 excinuclease ABC subunit C [Pseudoalteromonas amylolytica]
MVIEPRDTKKWFVYIVETKFGHWYTGITTDVAKRFAAHSAGTGAKNLKGKGPLTLIFSHPVGDKSEASKLEWQIKKLSKAQKIQLVQSKGQSSNATIKSLMKLTTC